MSRTPLHFFCNCCCHPLDDKAELCMGNDTPIDGTGHTTEVGGCWWPFTAGIWLWHISKSLNPQVTAKVLYLHGVQRASTTTRHTCASNRDQSSTICGKISNSRYSSSFSISKHIIIMMVHISLVHVLSPATEECSDEMCIENVMCVLNDDVIESDCGCPCNDGFQCSEDGYTCEGNRPIIASS